MSNRKYRTFKTDSILAFVRGHHIPKQTLDALIRDKLITVSHRSGGRGRKITHYKITPKGLAALSRRCRSKDTNTRVHRNNTIPTKLRGNLNPREYVEMELNLIHDSYMWTANNTIGLKTTSV